ncbi:MAG: cell division protein FtsW [Phycisphaerae bacterium]|nr:putative lipid II flippase FtsW [Phycisphaerae bacterium]NUQ46653.1 cell division protein FtsW [Phycisphaerae bacterium]
MASSPTILDVPRLTSEPVRAADGSPADTSLHDGVLCIVVGLLGIGVVMGFSTAAQLTPPRTGAFSWFTPPIRQTAFSALALIAMVLTSRMDYRRLLGRTGGVFLPHVWLLIIAVGLAGAVLVPGVGMERNGAQRWLPLGPGALGMSFQPSEMMKPALVVFLAAYAVRHGPRLQSFFGGAVPALLVIGLCVGLVGIEDFGTAALLGVVGGAMLWSCGVRRSHLVAAAVPALAGLGFLLWLKPYRLQRLMGFLTVWEDRQGAGYHAFQSMLSIASGGWTGRGLGCSVQKYGYLPEARTDFVFAVLCEELGIIGGACVILLFTALVWQTIRIVRRAPDEFGRLIALGAGFTIGVQAAINVGVVTVFLPTKGISLPFVSAGGSSTVFLGFLAGLLASVGRRTGPPQPLFAQEAT